MAGGTGKEINDRQRAFIDAYISNGFNGTAAAIAAGYSKNAASAAAWEVLSYPKVRRAINQHLRDSGLTRERMLKELAAIALSMDVADAEPLLNGGSLKALRASGVDTRNIKKIQVRRETEGRGEDAIEYERVTVELVDRQRAIEKLVDVLGAMSDDDGSVDRERPDAPVDAVAFPSSAIPAVPRPDEVQAGPSGEADGQNGDGETEARGGANHQPVDPPPVA